MNVLINLLSVFFVLVALVVVLVILMQRPKSEGLGAAFGGGVTENIFGAQTTNVLVKFTTWLAGVFFALTFGLSVLYAHRGAGGDSAFRRELMKQQAAPATSPGPATPQASPASSPASSPIQASPASSPAPAAQPTAKP
jgi:preprotein translocase subunit SecG